MQTVHTKHLPRTEFSNLRHYHGSKWPLTKSLTYWPKWSRNPHVVIFPILSSSDYTRRTNPRRNFRWSRSSAQRISHELRLSSTSLLDTFIWQCDRIIPLLFLSPNYLQKLMIKYISLTVYFKLRKYVSFLLSFSLSISISLYLFLFIYISLFINITKTEYNISRIIQS